jgi:hypothetical protein
MDCYNQIIFLFFYLKIGSHASRGIIVLLHSFFGNFQSHEGHFVIFTLDN